MRCLFCKKQTVQRYKTQKFCCIACANRFNLNNKNCTVQLPKSYSVELAELFGVLLGDGSVTRYYTKIYLNAIADKEYWPVIFALCKKLFPGAHISATARPSRGTHEIQISSKDVSSFLLRSGFKPKTRIVPSWISKDSSFAKAVVRGLIDTEGTVGLKRFNGKSGAYIYAQLTFTNTNGHLLSFVTKVLRTHGFSPTRKARRNVYVSNTRDIDRYMLEIGSSNPKIAAKLAQRVSKRGRSA